MKCSIITVCYNNREGLRKTCESVAKQTFKDYEFIIIDGGSTDGSADLFKDYASIITYCVSEKDKGIYNAMNKGIAVAKGEYCLFLNSGDYLSDSKVFERVFSNNYTEDILYGNAIRTKGRKKKVVIYPDSLTIEDFAKRSACIHHQASFIKKDLFSKYGNYREDLYLNSDWHFFFNTIAVNKVSTRHINTLVAVCDADGRSNAYVEGDPRLLKDELSKQDVLSKLFPNSIKKGSIDKTNNASKFLWNLSVLFPLSFYINLAK